MPDGQVLEFTRVTKRYGDVTALADFSARVSPGAVTGLLGPNGAGKTTTLRILTGDLRATSGTATIGGVPYSELRHPLRTVGFVLEDAAYRPRRTAERQLQIAAKANRLPASRVAEVLALVGLQNDADTRIGTFSLGMRQRLSVAGALLGDPGALVLDEPANGLDPEGIRWMRLLMRRLADEGRTVLVSSHVLSEVEQVADDVVVLAKGRPVYTGSIDTLSDPTTGAVIVDAEDRGALRAAIAAAGLDFDTLRSGITVRGSDAATVGALAAKAGIALTVLQQRGPSLEEVFLDLVYGRRPEIAHPSPVADAAEEQADADGPADADGSAAATAAATAAAAAAIGGAGLFGAASGAVEAEPADAESVDAEPGEAADAEAGSTGDLDEAPLPEETTDEAAGDTDALLGDSAPAEDDAADERTAEIGTEDTDAAGYDSDEQEEAAGNEEDAESDVTWHSPDEQTGDEQTADSDATDEPDAAEASDDQETDEQAGDTATEQEHGSDEQPSEVESADADHGAENSDAYASDDDATAEQDDDHEPGSDEQSSDTDRDADERADDEQADDAATEQGDDAHDADEHGHDEHRHDESDLAADASFPAEDATSDSDEYDAEASDEHAAGDMRDQSSEDGAAEHDGPGLPADEDRPLTTAQDEGTAPWPDLPFDDTRNAESASSSDEHGTHDDHQPTGEPPIAGLFGPATVTIPVIPSSPEFGAVSNGMGLFPGASNDELDSDDVVDDVVTGIMPVVVSGASLSPEEPVASTEEPSAPAVTHEPAEQRAAYDEPGAEDGDTRTDEERPDAEEHRTEPEQHEVTAEDPAGVVETAGADVVERAPEDESTVLPFATEAISVASETREPTFTELITGIPASEQSGESSEESSAEEPSSEEGEEDPRMGAMRASIAAAARTYFEDPAPAYPYGQRDEQGQGNPWSLPKTPLTDETQVIDTVSAPEEGEEDAQDDDRGDEHRD